MRPFISLAVVALALVGAGYLWFQPTLPLDAPARRRSAILDGAFIVVERTTPSFWTKYIPRLPGGSGDSPGTVTIYRKDGTNCGAAKVEIIGSYTLDVDEATMTASLERPPTAKWDLTRCRRSD